MLALRNFVQEWQHKTPKEKIFIVLGAVFLVAALIGVAIPVIPQVPFAVISAYFFSKGSARIHQWIRKNNYLGKPVRDWEDHRVVRPKLKIISVIAMLGGAGIVYWKLESPWTYLIWAAFLLSIVFVLTRKSKA